MTAASFEQLMALAAADPERWWDRFERSGQQLGAGVRDDALAVVREAIQADDLGRAQVAAMVAREVLLARGDRNDALAAHIEVVRLTLADAHSVEENARARLMAAECVTLAEGLRDDDLALAAAVVVGASAHGAWVARARVDGVDAANQAWLRRMLDDLVDALRRTNADASCDTLARLAELASLVVDTALAVADVPPEPAGQLHLGLTRVLAHAAACGEEVVNVLEHAAAGLAAQAP